jgi:HTH-type transcriptional regulator/antitoxin HigA
MRCSGVEWRATVDEDGPILSPFPYDAAARHRFQTTMDIRPIRTDEDHRAALAAIEACWCAPDGTEEGDKLDVLLALVEIYEARRWPIEIDDTFDPIDVLRYAIDELGHTQAELAELLGSRSRASEILARRRALTVEMIHKVGEAWKIPADLLVRPYKIERAA